MPDCCTCVEDIGGVTATGLLAQCLVVATMVAIKANAKKDNNTLRVLI